MTLPRLLISSCLLLPCAANAAVGEPRFEPPRPGAMQPVSMVVTAGGCTFLTDLPDEAEVIVQGSKIEVVIDGIHSPFVGSGCPDPFTSYTFHLGEFPAGQYQVHITIRDAIPAPFTLYRSLQIAPLRIGPVMARAIPASGVSLLSLLAVLLLLCSFRARPLAMLALLAWLPAADVLGDEPGVIGVAVLLANTPGSATPAEIVDGYDFSSSGAPPLAGLAVGNPLRAAYLTGERARGDYAAWLAQHPDSELAKLERYIVVVYRSSSDAQIGIDALRAGSDVANVYALPAYRFTADSVAQQSALSDWPPAVGSTSSSPKGWALIGVVDVGIATEHPLLREYSETGALADGGFRAALSYDFGHQAVGPLDGNVDELQNEPALPADVSCDQDHDGLLTSAIAGHGTHVAGLLVGSGGAVAGTCPGCSLAVTRIALLRCRLPGPIVRPAINPAAVVPALRHLANAGAQVISQSFGQGNYVENDHCLSQYNDATCLQIAALAKRDILLVAASGNDRTRIDFPARDPRLIAVGGVDTKLAFWDDDTVGPDLTDGCPTPGQSAECGSNFTQQAGERKQDFVAPARDVQSTTYPGRDWNPVVRCGDGFGTPTGDGVGTCTGTSMSAPLVAGIAASVRSVNPLLSAADVKGVLVAASIRPDGGAGWDARLGHGIPQRDVAIQLALGHVAKRPLRTRVTPLFSLQSTGALDRAAVSSPQLAMALLLGPEKSWVPVGAPVAGYPAFSASFPDVPRAELHVFTTDDSPFVDRQMIALRLMRRARSWPIGCVEDDPGCATAHIDYLLSSDAAEVPQLVASGFQHLGTQGYVVKRCSPEPACIPAGAVEVLRLCSAAMDDCAIFPRGAEAMYAALGYTTPVGASSILGYAFPNVDADGDALIDGFEILLGLNPELADSDKDGVPDGVEFPLAGVAISDPCPRGICDKSFVFANGYE